MNDPLDPARWRTQVPNRLPTTPILAIDPGTHESGVVRIEDGRVESSGVLRNEDLLTVIADSGAQTAVLVIEMVASYGMPVGKEVFETCVWIGRFQQAWRAPNQVRKIYRRDVKLHLCGNARAKDSNVRQALIDSFGGAEAIGNKKTPGPLHGVKSHAWAALAVAVTALECA